MAGTERRHTCFEKRSMFALFHSSFFCFIREKNGRIEHKSRMWHRVPLLSRIGCQGFTGSIPSAFLDDQQNELKELGNDC